MAKKTARNRALHLDQLTGRANDIASTILNSIAFHKYGDCCGIDDLTEQFKTTPARLNTTLRKLEDGGLITIEGEVNQAIYPTVKLLREQDSTLSSEDAEKIIRRLRR
jgi:hypothetical protein